MHTHAQKLTSIDITSYNVCKSADAHIHKTSIHILQIYKFMHRHTRIVFICALHRTINHPNTFIFRIEVHDGVGIYKEDMYLAMALTLIKVSANHN